MKDSIKVLRCHTPIDYDVTHYRAPVPILVTDSSDQFSVPFKANPLRAFLVTCVKLLTDPSRNVLTGADQRIAPPSKTIVVVIQLHEIPSVPVFSLGAAQ